MKKISFLQISFITIFCLTQTIKAPKKPSSEPITQTTTFHEQTNQQNLLIFLDDTENEVGAITGNFIDAFTQQTAPILASTSILYRLRQSYKLITFSALQEPLIATSKDPGTFSSAIQFEKKCSENWILKQIHPNLCLLLPKNYLQKNGISIEEASKVTSQKTLSETELKLGLKINHFPTPHIQDIARLYTSDITTSGPINYFINQLAHLFVTNKEYANYQAIALPTWFIYITGHGLMNERICGLSLNDFKFFLNFLEKITTKLLLYASCYAAGMNTELIYKDAQSGAPSTYSFPIITKALTDAPSELIAPQILENNTLKNGMNFNELLETINSSNSYQKLASLLAPQKGLIEAKPHSDSSRLPQIRYPGLEWFSILDATTVAPIGAIMGATREKPLYIANFYRTLKKPLSPEGILLYAQKINFELIINTKKAGFFAYVPKFISMIPGNAMHHIQSITISNDKTLEDALNAFYIEDLLPHKVFFIDEITGKLSPYFQKTFNTPAKTGTLRNVIIQTHFSPENFKVTFSWNYGQYYSFSGLASSDTVFKPIHQSEYAKLANRLYPGISEQAEGLPITVFNRPSKLHPFLPTQSIAAIHKGLHEIKYRQQQKIEKQKEYAEQERQKKKQGIPSIEKVQPTKTRERSKPPMQPLPAFKPTTPQIPQPSRTPLKPAAQQTPPPVPPRDDVPRVLVPATTPQITTSRKPAAQQTPLLVLQNTITTLNSSYDDALQISLESVALSNQLNLLDKNDLSLLEKSITAFNTKKGAFKKMNGTTIKTLLEKALNKTKGGR